MSGGSFTPNQEGVQQLVALLTNVQNPGANQTEVGGPTPFQA